MLKMLTVEVLGKRKYNSSGLECISVKSVTNSLSLKM